MDWRSDPCWLLKPAYGNNGDDVILRAQETDREWERRTRTVGRHPDRWVAQRRFDTVPISSPAGIVYPCIGVYTIDGHACGIYGRYGTGALIDYAAVDVAVLVEHARAPR